MRIRTHPGEVPLEEFMKPYGLGNYDIAKNLGVPEQIIENIINEKQGVNADIAPRLARYFGTTPVFWLNLQNNYDISAAENKMAEELKGIIPLGQDDKIIA